MRKSELKREFPFVSEEYINAALEKKYPFHDYKTERGVFGKLRKLNESAKEIVEMPDVKTLDINMVYTKGVYGLSPLAYYQVTFSDGSCSDGKTSYYSGCGYDKTSCALADVFNEVCKGMALRKMKRNKNIPYGIYKTFGIPCFHGGIGESCYYEIAKYLGLKKIVVHRGIKENFYSFSK